MVDNAQIQSDIKQAMRSALGEIVPAGMWSGSAWKDLVLSPAPLDEYQWEIKLGMIFNKLNEIARTPPYSVEIGDGDSGATYGKKLRVTQRHLYSRVKGASDA